MWCAGDQFALFESVVALAVLLRRFEFTMAPDAPPVNMTTARPFPMQTSFPCRIPHQS